MAAEMTRLPTFNDLKIGALAENGIREDKEERGQEIFQSLDKNDGCNSERRKPTAILRKKSRVP